MKKIIAIVLIVLTVSCSKSSNTCWHCTFGITNGGTPRPPLDTCGDDNIGQQQFYDSNGVISASCVRK